jgi:hypothetical protein
MIQPTDQFQPGMIVQVTQQIPQRDGDCWTTTLRGTVVDFQQKKTGSWFAHAKDDKLWLDRLTLKTEDGEISELVLDPYTHVEIIRPAPQ